MRASILSVLEGHKLLNQRALPQPAPEREREVEPNCPLPADSTLLVSGSADKNLKIWGLDFGDCHRSLFAHSDSVMQVAFVPNTHYVFTVGE